MKETLFLTYRIGNEAGFYDNEYLRESLRTITDQIGIIRESHAWYFDTDKMDLYAEGRFVYLEQTIGTREFIMGETKQRQGVIQTVESRIQRKQGQADELGYEDIEEFIRRKDLKRLFSVHRSQCLYWLGGCNLVWQRADWQSQNVERSFQVLQLSTESGNEAQLFALACRLSSTLRLQFETRTMEMWALHELTSSEEPFKETRSKFITDQNTAAGWLAGLLLDSSTSLVEAMGRFLSSPGDAEMLHQMRIRLRILRSVLTFGKNLMLEKDYKTANETLQELGRTASATRDLEVLGESVRAVGEIGVDRLLQEIEEKREQAYIEVHTFIQEGMATALLTQFLSCTQPRDRWKQDAWRQAAVEYRSKTRDAWLKRLMKKSEKFSQTDMERTHRLRIQVKKLRYVLRATKEKIQCERALVKLLGELQDVLGHIHDRSQQSQMLTLILQDTPDTQVQFEAGYYLGVWASKEEKEREILGEQAQELFKRLRKIDSWS